MSNAYVCPSCEATAMSVFYEVPQVPVNSVLLLPTREEAVTFPKGDIKLGFCTQCGFISNVAFDNSKQEYSERSEETQGYSPTFNAFARALAERLIERFDLHDKDILEIGCGKGEFLTELCELGGNRGVGVDPAYIASRSLAKPNERVSFIADYYSEKYTHIKADFVVCKMTFEHIPNTGEFLRMIRRTLDSQPDAIVFFQIPEVRRVLTDIGFWDVYYEHCSYFSPGSLARLFRNSGFDVLDLWTEYDNQYLMITAKPGTGKGGAFFGALEDDLQDVASEVKTFAEQIGPTLQHWKSYLQDIKQSGRKAVLWQSGSKGVAFLTTLNIWDEIEYTVDINPNKPGMFMAGTGQEIVAPEFLRSYQPDVVIIMNPIYKPEIERELARLGVQAEVRTI